jgi:hypothetical protein
MGPTWWLKFQIFPYGGYKSYMKNLITSIKQDDRNYITNHDHKAAIIWNSYKERLGITNNPIMAYDLDNLVNRLDLLHLDEPFTKNKLIQL